MADSTFLAPVISNLIQLMIPEVKSLKGVRREAESLRKELEIIQSFLKDVGARTKRGSTTETLKTWVKHVREQADRIEDVIDEYLHYVSKCRGNESQGGFAGPLCKLGRLVRAVKPRYDMATEIKSIKESLLEIKDRGQRYGLSQVLTFECSVETRSDDPRFGSIFVEEAEFLDAYSLKDELVNDLTELGASKRVVISLVGEGGIGKTTLAKKVYEEVKECFDCCAWITVSPAFDILKILKILTKQIHPTKKFFGSTEELDTIEELISHLRQHLETKRYVIVFDDVWQEDFWGLMKHAMPINNNGSRLIITTRNSMVAGFCKETPADFVKILKTWSIELAWILFCRKAFKHDFDGNCPQKLEDLSHEIVRKCQGLPLAVSAIASLLSTKEKVESEWQRVFNNLDSELATNLQLKSILKILSLSYQDLPSHLKPCFLYFGIFPKSYPISDRMLYQLWIAEGFVEEKSNLTSEEVAEEYLNELIYRNMVIFEVHHGNIRWCGVHDLMREFILLEASKLCFSRAWDGKNSISFSGKVRRLSIYNSLANVLSTFKESRIRSIFLFDVDESSMSFINSLLGNFKLLKVLHFSRFPLKNLPKEMGSLFHLKYLNLEGTNIKEIPDFVGNLHNLQTLNLANTSVKMLPKSVGKLLNLQTLDLTNTLIEEIPIEINKLRFLRHLIARRVFYEIEFALDSIGGVKLQEDFGCLENLETLLVAKAQHNGVVDLTKELEKLKKLKSLGISNLTTETGRAVCSSIEMLRQLQDLVLLATREDEVLDLQPISSPSPFLRELVFLGILEKFPDWISKLWNLQILRLFFSRLRDTPLENLKGLPNLTNLALFQAYDGERLHFGEGSFRKLEKLTLRKLERLKLVEIDKGALPLLRRLHIGPCSQLKEVPSGIQHLRNLKQLQIIDMSNEFVLGVQPNQGLHFSKIKHVPSVYVSYSEEGLRHHKYVYKLGEPDLLERLQGYVSNTRPHRL